MKALKFRAWDNIDYMSNPFTLEDLQLGIVQFTKDCNVMQFSGLLDCKGKEVYEGDVLRETIEHDMGDENLYYIVKWFQPTCSFVAMSYADTVTDWEDSEDSKEEYPTPLTPEDCKRLTVCGNEHQNPDWFTKD